MNGRLLVLAAILLALLPLRLASSPGAGPYGIDASWYFEIGRHVAEGDGLRTNVSLWYEGTRQLPAFVRVYPLWPLLLGWTGRLIGLVQAANLLPQLLYVADLLLLYLLCRRLAQRVAGGHGSDDESDVIVRGRYATLDAGHLVVLTFATNRVFYASTTNPYTEGLAFCLAFAALLFLDRAAEQASWRWALAAGVTTSLAFLARSQMICLAAALLPVMALYAFRNREMRRPAAWFATGLFLGAVPWYIFLGLHFPSTALNPLTGLNPFFKYRETPELDPFQPWVIVPSLSAWLADRLPGILVAFDPQSPLSYFSSFGAAVALVPLAAVLALSRLRKLRLPGDRRTLLLAALIMAGLVFHLTLMQFHATYFLPWLFGWRHGLGFVFLLVPAVIFFLIRTTGVIRGLAIAVTVAGVLANGFQLVRTGGAQRPAFGTAERELTQWIDAQRPVPTILTTNAQVLGMMSRGKYHWIDCPAPPSQTARMLDLLPIDEIVVYSAERPCTWVSGLLGRARLVRSFRDERMEIDVFAKVPAAARTPGPGTNPW